VIGYLNGTARAADLVVTSAGVGFEVTCPRPLTVGADVELYVHTSVRENGVSLYGFDQPVEREAFRALLAVNGVGPQAALALLRDVGVSGVAAAVNNKDPKALTKASGVGGKLAERIVALCAVGDEWAQTGDGDLPLASELALTLAGLGFDDRAAQEAAHTAVATSSEDADESELLAVALAHLRSPG
jgi:Holliday junction DNA helicase RuvA